MNLTFKSLIEFVHKVNSDESGNPDPYIASLNSVVRNDRLPGLDPDQRDALLKSVIEELKGEQGVIAPKLRESTVERTWLGYLRFYVDLVKLQEVFKKKKIPSSKVIVAEILVDSPAWAVASHPYLMREIPARVVRALEEMGLQRPRPGRIADPLIKDRRKLVHEHIEKYQDFFNPGIKNKLIEDFISQGIPKPRDRDGNVQFAGRPWEYFKTHPSAWETIVDNVLNDDRWK